MKNIVSWSGGKDSTATIIVAHEHGIPIDEIVMAVLWFDKSRNIPAILPEHWEFITKVAKPQFEVWGYKVTFVDARFDYITEFHKVVQRSKKPEQIGKKNGFVIAGFCRMTSLKRDCIHRIERTYKDYCSLQGIAADETERLERLHNRHNAISLLEQYGIVESEARQLCEQYGLLSPIYTTGGGTQRDGCWFCPNSTTKQFANIKKNHPDLWDELKALSQEDNLSSHYFKYNKTFADVDRQVDWQIYQQSLVQMSIFDLLTEES